MDAALGQQEVAQARHGSPAPTRWRSWLRVLGVAAMLVGTVLVFLDSIPDLVWMALLGAGAILVPTPRSWRLWLVGGICLAIALLLIVLDAPLALFAPFVGVALLLLPTPGSFGDGGDGGE